MSHARWIVLFRHKASRKHLPAAAPACKSHMNLLILNLFLLSIIIDLGHLRPSNPYLLPAVSVLWAYCECKVVVKSFPCIEINNVPAAVSTPFLPKYQSLVLIQRCACLQQCFPLSPHCTWRQSDHVRRKWGGASLSCTQPGSGANPQVHNHKKWLHMGGAQKGGWAESAGGGPRRQDLGPGR